MVTKLKFNALTLADKIIDGFNISHNEKDFLLKCDLNELILGADKIRNFFIGNFVEMCSIISAKSGRCAE